MPIVLNKTDGSPPARAVLMVIDILGLKVETTEVMPMKGDTMTPEFLEKNPLHTIPFLEDGTFKLADSHAIITYLVSKYGSCQRATLYPNDMEIRATIDQRMYLDASILFPYVRTLIETLIKEKKRIPTEEQSTSIKEIYGVLEKYSEKTKFLAANHLTLADISLVSTISTLDCVVPVEEFSKLTAWYTTLKKYDWYKTANEPGLAQIVAFIKAKNDELN